MEWIIVLLVLWGLWTLIKKAAGAPNPGGNNPPAERLQIRVVERNLEEDGPEAWIVEAKGILPVQSLSRINFITSLFDVTDGDFKPVMASFEEFMEPETMAFQHKVEGPQARYGDFWPNWVGLGIVFPELLMPPKGGRREIEVVWRIVDADSPPTIALGNPVANASSILAELSTKRTLDFKGKGYAERAESREQARKISIQLGLAVAFSDGEFSDSEGLIVRDWVERWLSVYSGEVQERLKAVFNEAITAGIELGSAGDLSISNLVAKLEDVAEEPEKYEAIELCMDVMAADGVAQQSELEVIHKIAEALGLDYSEIERMRDKRIVRLEVKSAQHADIETVLGIQSDWSNEKIQSFLRKEFAKWNNRLNTLPHGSERENAQRMLDAIAEARRKYGRSG